MKQDSPSLLRILGNFDLLNVNLEISPFLSNFSIFSNFRHVFFLNFYFLASSCVYFLRACIFVPPARRDGGSFVFPIFGDFFLST